MRVKKQILLILSGLLLAACQATTEKGLMLSNMTGQSDIQEVRTDLEKAIPSTDAERFLDLVTDYN